MKNFKLVIFLLLSSSIFAQKTQDEFVIKGKITANYSGYIYINYEDKEAKVDSCLIKNNTFSFKRKINNDVVSSGIYLKSSNTPGIYLEKGKTIEVSISSIDSKTTDGIELKMLTIDSIQGSKTAVLEKAYEAFIKQNEKLPNYETLLINKVNEIIIQNPKNPFSSSIFNRLLYNDKYDKTVLKEMYLKLEKESLTSFRKKRIENILFPERYVKINGPVYNFTLPDTNGEKINTESLKGKWFLIDFWASWCGPCREQIPELKKIYETYKSKNFEVVAVSIDKRKDKWIEAVKKEKIKWINLNENEHFYGQIVKTYNINSIPSNFLINPNGEIVKMNISMSELEILLKDLN